MLSQRLGSDTQKDPRFIDKLIHEISIHPGSCDEVWFATDYGFPKLSTHAETARTIADAAEKFKALGVRVSLQLSNSVGHGEYMSKCDNSGLCYDGSPVEKMVGHDGIVAGYAFCFRGKHFREYLLTEIREYIRTVRPHTFWVDDDLRARNHAPVNFGCFCDDCIEAFNKRYGSDFSREELVSAINSDIEWRKRHVGFIRDSLYDLAFAMGTAVHDADPECRIGYQHGLLGGFIGFGYDFIFDAFYKSTGIAPAHRPGGGVYDDSDPADILGKGELLNYQNYLLPEYVTDKRPEIENLPDIVYGKSIGGTCFETSYYLATGNNAMSYAMLMEDYEPMAWQGKMLGAFASHRKYWEKLCKYNNISHQTGLKVALAHKGYLRKTNKLFEYNREFYDFGMPLRFFNIPVAMTREDMPVCLISADSVDSYTDEEIEFLLGKPVVTDGEALRRLNERGVDVGADAREIDTQNYSEFFTDHEINKDFKGRTWGGGWLRFNNWELLGDVEAVGIYGNKADESVSREHVASGAFTTSAGAKWYVGFDLWNRGVSTEKRDQLLNAIEYISGTRFAAELKTPIQAIVHPRVNEQGKTVCVSITNVTVGPSGELELIIRDPESLDFTFMAQYQDEMKPLYERLEGEKNAYIVKLPNICGWSVGTVFC